MITELIIKIASGNGENKWITAFGTLGCWSSAQIFVSYFTILKKIKDLPLLTLKL